MLTGEQQKIVNEIINHPAQITFIQGKAGSGKTFLIKTLAKKLYNLQILCPTNLAASIYKDNKMAKTIHSFFYGAFDDIDEGYQNPQNYPDNELKKERFKFKLQNVNTIIFDEISMVRADTFEMMNKICQVANNSSIPFGGIRIIIVGDLFQLPPIVEDEATYSYLKKEYNGFYFFNSHVIQKNISSICFFELNSSIRQDNDKDFEEVLDGLRTLPIDVSLLDYLNTRIFSDVEIPSDIPVIATSNSVVQNINETRLKKLPGNLFISKAKIEIKERINNEYLEFDFEDNYSLDNDRYYNLELPSQFEGCLCLKIGARVICTRNDKKAGYINGDFGTVTNVSPSCVDVRLDRTGSIISVEKYSIKKYKMVYDEKIHELHRVIPYFQRITQFPLKSAYAFTVHKSQGQTYDRMMLDLQSHIFERGQLYVALSRVKNLHGLYLNKALTCSDIMIDTSVFDFLNIMRRGCQKSLSLVEKDIDNDLFKKEPIFSNYSKLKSMIGETNASRLGPNVNFILLAFKQMFIQKQYRYACMELQKITDIIGKAYQADNYREHIKRIKKIDLSKADKNTCFEVLSWVIEIYEAVYHYPRSILVDQFHFFISDNN